MTPKEKRSVRKSGYYKARKRAENKIVKLVSAGVAAYDWKETDRRERMVKRVNKRMARPFTLGELLKVRL